MIVSILRSMRICGLCDCHFLDDLPCDICPRCWERLPLYDGPVCQVCQKPLPLALSLEHSAQPNHVHCSDCCMRMTFLDGCFYIGLYSGYLKDTIFQLKYKGFTHMGEVLGRILADAMPGEYELSNKTVVVPIPLHPRKLAERGYNQAQAIAAGLASALSVPLSADALASVRETADQKYLSAAARMRNVLHAFTVASELVVSGKDIILVDDVMTTGSTLNEAARTVKLAGARSAVAAVAASGLGYPCMCERWKDTGSRS